MTRAVCALWGLVLVTFVLLYADFILKASDQLRSHRADSLRPLSAPRDVKSISHARSIAMKEQQRAA